MDLARSNLHSSVDRTTLISIIILVCMDFYSVFMGVGIGLFKWFLERLADYYDMSYAITGCSPGMGRRFVDVSASGAGGLAGLNNREY